MDNEDIFEILKKHGFLTKALEECNMKKSSSIPKGEIAENEVYCKYLSHSLQKIKEQLFDCQHISCIKETTNISNEKQLKCLSMQGSMCNDTCKYYKDIIRPLEEARDEIFNALGFLKNKNYELYFKD